MSMKKIIVLGASGFIGRNILEYFAKLDNYEVYGTYFNAVPFEIEGAQLIKADLKKEECVKEVLKDKDIVVHSAAVTSGAKDIQTRPYIHITDNAIMTSLIMRYAYELSIPHLILFSCSIIYHHSEIPLKESDLDLNREMFPSYFGAGWNKVYFEKMAEFYSRLGRNKYTVIRHSNIYGPWDKYDLESSHVFGATVTKVMTTAENGNILVWGDGEEGRDLLYVDDLVSFVKRAINGQEKPFALYNVGSGRVIKIKDLVQKIIDASGKKLNVIFDKTKPSLKTTICLDYERAKNELGWMPQVSLDEGIKKTIHWFKNNFNK